MIIEFSAGNPDKSKCPPYPSVFVGQTGFEAKSPRTGPSSATVVWVPSPPVGETQNTIKTFSQLPFSGSQRLVAVTNLPRTLDSWIRKSYDMQPITGVPSYAWTDHLLFYPDKQFPKIESFDPALPPDNIIFLPPNNRTSRAVSHALREIMGIDEISMLHNTHIGFEVLASEVAQDFRLNYAPPEVVNLFSSKSEFHAFQRKIGLRAPKQSPIITATSKSEESEAILSWIERLGEETKKDKVVLKAVIGHGSVSVYFIEPSWPLEKRKKEVSKHLTDRNHFGKNSTIVEEFMEGIEVGAHITTSGGKIAIKYTRKTMATGASENQSEEVEHIIDPKDPIFDLCEKTIGKKIHTIFQKLDLLQYNMAYNADAKLDKKYFDGDQIKKRPPSITDDDNSYINEINPRKGGVAIENLIAAATGQPEYPLWEMLATLGQSDAIDAMNRAVATKAAIIHTDYWDKDGFLIGVPSLSHLWQAQQIDPKKIFYKKKLILSPGKPPKIYDTRRHISLIGDYLTKGDDRPVYGVWGETLEEARKNLNALKSRDPAVLLSEGKIYVNSKYGGYQKLDVVPGSDIVTFLETERELKLVQYQRGWHVSYWK